jgi:predicted ATPase
MMTRLAIAGYRSLRDITVTLNPLNVVTGGNGSGKSSLYRALKLLADIAQGRFIQSLATEGACNRLCGRACIRICCPRWHV